MPILPFYNDGKDDEMLHLLHYLMTIAESPDFRVNNQEAFQLRILAENNKEESDEDNES